MKSCCRCGNTHVGSLIYASPGFMFLFQQEFEQWCDMSLKKRELAKIRSLPMVKPKMSALPVILAMVH